MTATEAFQSITNGGTDDFADVVALLNRHGAWCLIGGLAVNCYVEPVYTLDADLVVVAEQLSAIEEGLAKLGFTVQRFANSINAQRAKSRLNVQLTTDPRYQEFLARASPAEVLGRQVPVASLNDLLRGKIWAWTDKERRISKRKKDELDLLRIAEAYPELRSSLPKEINDQLPHEN